MAPPTQAEIAPYSTANMGATSVNSPQIKIYIINLARSQDRRVKMISRLRELDLQFEFFDGVDGALLSARQMIEVYKPIVAFNRLGRELHPNEMACSWSHIKIYERMVSEVCEECVVLEDDVDLHDCFPAILATRREWLPQDWRVVNFAHDMAEPVQLAQFATQGLNHVYVCRFDTLVGRTGAYLISLDGAKNLLKHAYPIRMPPDDLVGDASFVGAPVYGVVPRVAVWNAAYASTIWTDKTRDQFAAESRSGLRGLLRRIWGRLRRLVV